MKSESRVFKRDQWKDLERKIKKGQSFLLLGPRQTGKSTLLEDLFSAIPDCEQIRYYFQLPATREKIEEDPEVIVREVEAKWTGKPIFLLMDEIQKAPAVLDVLQFLIDQKKIVLAASGSSTRKMRALGANWLPGRIHLEYLNPLSWEECGVLDSPRSLNEYLLYGSLPGVLSQSDLDFRRETLASYTHLYLEEEIRMEAVVRNLPRFTQFLRLAALESGTAPNYSKMASQIGVSHTTIREYFQILEDSLIIHRLPSFSRSRDQVVHSSKYYFFDIGVRNAAARVGHDEGILQLQRGILFEHWIVLELMARFRSVATFFYWRTKQGHEVDLIIEKRNQRMAIEIKSTRHPLPQDFKNLEYFQKKHSLKHCWLVCCIDRPQKFENGLAIPWQELSSRINDL